MVIYQLLSSEVKSLIVDNGKVTSSIKALHQEQNTHEKLDHLMSVQERTIEIIIQLLTLIHSNEFIPEMAMDNCVTVATTEIAANQSNVPMITQSLAVVTSHIFGTSIMGSASLSGDDASQIATYATDTDRFSHVVKIVVSNDSAEFDHVPPTPIVSEQFLYELPFSK